MVADIEGGTQAEVFENRVLMRIFGPKMDDVTGEWRKLHNEGLNDLYSSPNTVRLIKFRTMRLAGHVARMGEGCTRFWWRNLRERDYWGDPGVDGTVILRWIFRKRDVGVWTRLTLRLPNLFLNFSTSYM
jgi:hypothetical protein